MNEQNENVETNEVNQDRVENVEQINETPEIQEQETAIPEQEEQMSNPDDGTPTSVEDVKPETKKSKTKKTSSRPKCVQCGGSGSADKKLMGKPWTCSSCLEIAKMKNETSIKTKEKIVPPTTKTPTKKPAAKTSAKPAAKPAPKASTNGKAAKGTAKPATSVKKKDDNGLRKPQVRILAALAKTGRPMTRVELAKAAPVDQATCVEYLGSADPEKRKANDVKHFPSLVSLGYVKQIMDDQDGSTVWVHTITATGKKALESASK